MHGLGSDEADDALSCMIKGTGHATVLSLILELLWCQLSVLQLGHPHPEAA